MPEFPLASPDLPLVSVVTPSYNTAKFLRETIESVLTQDYPRVEYIVMDGGSSDGTLAILREYEGRLAYVSERDAGAADAINKGFRRSSGSIFTYLNADDTFLPGAISAGVAALAENPGAAVVYGDGFWVEADGRTIGPYPAKPYDARLLEQECFICQPASFIRREAFEQAGLMDGGRQFTFDYDLWIRIARLYSMKKIDRFLATSRMHRDNKTVGQRRGVLQETLEMLIDNYEYVPYHWVCQYACYLVDGKDQFFERTHLSISKYLLTLALGLRRNWRHPVRFLEDWSQAITFEGLVRRCHSLLNSSGR